MPPLDDPTRLRHMLEACERTLRLLHNRKRSDLDSDELFELGMLKLLEIIGEAAARVSEPARASHAEISWPEIIGLRNRLIHAYDLVDRNIVWRILTTDLPGLAASLRKIVSPPAP